MDAAIAFMQMMIWVTLLWIGYRLDRLEGRPKSTSIPQLFNLTVKAVKARKIRNLNNAPVVVDVDESLVLIMACWILSELETHKSADEVDLSESKWVRRGGWRDMTDGSPEQWRAVMDRLQDAGVVARAGKKNTRVLALPYSRTRAILRGMVSTPPPTGR